MKAFSIDLFFWQNGPSTPSIYTGKCSFAKTWKSKFNGNELLGAVAKSSGQWNYLLIWKSFFNWPYSYGKGDQVLHPYILGNVAMPRLGKDFSMEMSWLVQWRKVAVSEIICSQIV